MAWRNYKDNCVVWFGSKGKRTLSTGESNVIMTKTLPNNRMTYVYNGKLYSGQTFSIVSLDDSNTGNISIKRGSTDIFTISISGKETKYNVLTSNMFTYDESTNTTTIVFDLYFMTFVAESLLLNINSYGVKIPAENFVDEQSGTASSLTQLLSVIKGEIWYNINYGLPLYDKISTKLQMDASVIQIINNHSEVSGIQEFDSTISGNKYSLKVTVESIYGPLQIVI